MKWYIGIQAEIIAAIVSFGSIFAIQNQDSDLLPIPIGQTLMIAVFVIAFIGGFMAPYHVMQTAKRGAAAFAILAGIPLVLVLVATGEISGDDNADLGAILILILLLVVAIGLVIAIIVVTVLLFVGGTIGSIFGKMVFEESRYEDTGGSQKYHQEYG